MEIIESKYLISSPSVNECPKPDRPEIAFIGRSNVGKSSLINMLCNNSKLAKTSATPGKTQLINHFEIKMSESPSVVKNKKETLWYLVDLPGYGFAKVSQRDRRRWEQMIEGYIRKRKNLVTVFVLIDSRHEPQKIDLDFINKLGKWQSPFAIVFTKADKNKPQATVRNVNLFMQSLQQSWEQPPIFFISSAITKAGRREILEYIEKLKTH
ncbi:MAG TPA: ribosome biogenesis GTP-binding protein YihA/YsxC [Chitinophagaceae bacterium]|jgi:GTP-binding protein|nr:ribosome biogenesis GTP-binding protein YihA/YsxC [Chitinophagaceae bacterium]